MPRVAATVLAVLPIATGCAGSANNEVSREAALPTFLTHCITNLTDENFIAIVNNEDDYQMTAPPNMRVCAYSDPAPRDLKVEMTMSRQNDPGNTWSLKSRLTRSAREQFEVHHCGINRWESFNETLTVCAGERLKLSSKVTWYQRLVETVIEPNIEPN